MEKVRCYDRSRLSKIEYYLSVINDIVIALKYEDDSQLAAFQLREMLWAILKEMEHSDCGYEETMERVKHVRESEMFDKSVRLCSIGRYSFKDKIYARMIINKSYGMAYTLVRMISRLKGV